MLPLHRRCSLALLGAACALGVLAAGADQPAPPAPRSLGEGGAAIQQELRSFGTLGTVLHVGAHPDDENTQLITYLSLGRGYRVAYLSLTRGDGGQNELGPDFDEKLGVARTQELLAARGFDHGKQFFTRAIDFGFSKTPEETLAFWDRKEVLGDVVRVIRQFRPDVIVTRFPVPPGSGGHGHHTASAMLAVEAFKLAGDPTAYPEQLAQGLTVWQPKRVVWNSFGGGNGLNGPIVKMDIAGTDPVSGETFGTIANKSRGMHKTQGLGGFSGRTATGPNIQNFMLLGGDAATNDLMDGVDTTWSRYPGGAEIDQLVSQALIEQGKTELVSLRTLLEIRQKLSAFPHDPLLDDKRSQLDHLIAAVLGLRLEVSAPTAELVPGESVRFAFSAQMNTLEDRIPVRYLGIQTPLGKQRIDVPLLVPGKSASGELDISLPFDLPLTQPYWLKEEGSSGIARVSDPKLIGRAENPPSILVTHVIAVGGQEIEITDAPVNILHDEQGEHRRQLAIIPPVSLQFSSEIFLVPPGTTKPVVLEITAARPNLRGVLRLDVPPGWSAAPATLDFHLANPGDKTRVTFSVAAPSRADSARLTATAEVNGHKYSNQRYEIRYAHLPLQLLQPPARVRVASFPLATKGFTIGYLPGAGDAVAACLEQMGYIVHQLSGVDLTPERLKGLDAVVIGVRAFNERTDLKDALPGLFAWVEQGGTVIAQYNRPNGLKTPQLGPYPLSIEGPAPDLRVTDERAPVNFLATDNAVLNGPNKIAAGDFDGWVQERGAYFPSKWDDHYTPVLAMSDPGEAPLKSSILVARHGKGYYVYTGLAFFRQLPAGVPGAYRLMANLVALGKEP